jgi:hypothetical protein
MHPWVTCRPAVPADQIHGFEATFCVNLLHDAGEVLFTVNSDTFKLAAISLLPWHVL